MSELKRRSVSVAIGAMVLAAGGGLALIGAQRAQALETGAAAPGFALQDSEGRTRTLSEFSGRTVVLEWTNPSCPYVRKHYDSQNMQNLQQEAVNSGVVWLTVNSTNPGHRDFLDAAGVRRQVQLDNAPVTASLLDPTGSTGRAYGARNTPHMFVIGADGRVVYQGAIDDRPSARRDSLQGANNYVRAALADIAAGRAVRAAQTMPYGCTVKYAR